MRLIKNEIHINPVQKITSFYRDQKSRALDKKEGAPSIMQKLSDSGMMILLFIFALLLVSFLLGANLLNIDFDDNYSD